MTEEKSLNFLEEIIEERPDLDQRLAKELFGPEFELSITQMTIEASASRLGNMKNTSQVYNAGSPSKRMVRSNTEEIAVLWY